MNFFLRCNLLLLGFLFSTMVTSNYANHSNASVHASKPKELHYCSDQQYLCKGGKACIDRKFICDGIKDCPDGDDENGCDQRRNCEPGFYQCTHTTRCLPLFLVCNGIKDCVNGDDESISCTFGSNNSSGSELKNTRFANHSNPQNVNVSKVIPNMASKAVNYTHFGSGIFLINFGTLLSGNNNVIGNGNDYGNGNGNGVNDRIQNKPNY